MVWPKNIFIQTVVRQMDLSTYIGSVTLKEGRAIECVMLLFSSTTLGTCTRYGYFVKKTYDTIKSSLAHNAQANGWSEKN